MNNETNEDKGKCNEKKEIKSWKIKIVKENGLRNKMNMLKNQKKKVK